MWRDFLYVVIQIDVWFAWFLGLLAVVFGVGLAILYLIGTKLEYNDLKEQNARSSIS